MVVQHFVGLSQDFVGLSLHKTTRPLRVSLSVAHSPGGHAREYGKKERERKGLPESVGEERESRGRRQREKQETVQGKRPATKRLLQETKRHATEQDSKTARQQDSKTVEVQEVQEA